MHTNCAQLHHVPHTQSLQHYHMTTCSKEADYTHCELHSNKHCRSGLAELLPVWISPAACSAAPALACQQSSHCAHWELAILHTMNPHLTLRNSCLSPNSLHCCTTNTCLPEKFTLCAHRELCTLHTVKSHLAELLPVPQQPALLHHQHMSAREVHTVNTVNSAHFKL
jgi:hypothetical protein